MNKKKYFLLLIFYYFSCFGRQTLIENEFGLSSKKFKKLVAKRFYLIQRLSRSVEILKTVENIKDQDFYQYFDFNSFKHPIIKKSLYDIKNLCSLQPLFFIWNKFIRFKFLVDDLFAEELTKEICIISKVVLKKIQQYKIGHKKNILLLAGNINIIDQSSSYKYLLESSINSSSLALRFYILRRLEGPIKQIRFLLKKNKTILQALENINKQISNQVLKKIIKESLKENSFYPFLLLCKEVECYSNIYDHIFLREFLVCIAVIQYATVFGLGKKKNFLENSAQLYDALNKLPLKEILEIIDIYTQDLEPLLVKYELRSQMSWKSWIKKYWWIGPVATSFIIVKLFNFIKNQRIKQV